MTFAHIRREYLGKPLSETDSDPDPFRQFAQWFEDVRSLEADPTAMALATATRDGRPSVRTVLLKSIDERGFVFYTNYESRKGRELERDPRAALVFFWVELERQVRIQGSVERVSGAESDRYFSQRPRGSRLAAWASPQSASVPDRAWLEGRFTAAEERFREAGDAVPRPLHWGGFRVVPQRFEFWQGRSSRLHDRVTYARADDAWMIERLAP